MSDKDLEVLAYKSYGESKFLNEFSFTKSMCYVGGFADGYRAAEEEKQKDGTVKDFLAEIQDNTGRLICGKWCSTLQEATDWVKSTSLKSMGGSKAQVTEFTKMVSTIVLTEVFSSPTERMVSWAKGKNNDYEMISFPQDLVNEFIKEQESKKS